MKTSALFFSVVLFLIFSSCCHEEIDTTVIEDCDSIKEANILPEEEKESTCIYNEVYRYNSEIITLCVCCICDKVALMYDCDGNIFCDFDECYEDFNKNAEYLFSVK